MTQTLDPPTLPPFARPAVQQISNPILTGFHPDPSILRVGEDYYLATSTFEWFPGVRIHHSRDLATWRTIQPPLRRRSQLDMLGNPNSCGVWAPCLSHDGERFYLIYTDVKSWNTGPFKDTHNYLVTTNDIEGEWSEPIYLNSSGFDPSLFHDDDGRKWLLNMRWEHRAGHNQFSGILLQEFDARQNKLIGEAHNIFLGTPIGLVEGPHLYKHNGWYYLLTAEGGTSYEHAASLARSRSLFGPYQVHPHNPLLSSHGHHQLAIKKAGHASLVETQNGEWYLAHLCGRPLEADQERGYCPLGRETALQALEWRDDDWLYLRGGGNTPAASFAAPAFANVDAAAVANVVALSTVHDDFAGPELSLDWQSLRVPTDPSWLSLSDRPGYLRLYGRESLISLHQQSLIGRRLQHFYASASTKLEFEPQDAQQMAGLAAFYDTQHWVYLRVSRDELLGKTLSLLVFDAGQYTEPLAQEVSIEGWPAVYLRVTFERQHFYFEYSGDGGNWLRIGEPFETYKLSDDYCYDLSFTGAFIALCAQDLIGTRINADFDHFVYTPTA
jgi:xylan 1,4-beta-xylosidase